MSITFINRTSRVAIAGRVFGLARNHQFLAANDKTKLTPFNV